MKKLEKVKIVFDRLFNKVFNVRPLEKLIEQKENMTEVLNKVKDSKNNLKGIITVKERDNVQNKQKLAALESRIKEYITKKQLDKAEEGYSLKVDLEKEINRNNAAIESNKKILENTEKQITIYQKKIDKINNNICELKNKDEFIENAKEFKENIRAMDCEDVKDLTEEINKDYYAQTFAIEEIDEKAKDVDDYINEDSEGFKKYVEKVSKNTKKRKSEK